MYDKAALLCLCCAGMIPGAAAQSLEEFRRQNMAQFDTYKEDDARAFAAWKEQQARMYEDWSADARRYENTRVKTVTVSKHGEDAVTKRDLDYRAGKVSVSAVSGDSDSAAAVAKVKAALREDVKRAIVAADPEAMQAAPSRRIDEHVDAVVDETPVTVEKKQGGFIARATGSRDMTGDRGILALISPGTDDAPPIVDTVDYSALIVDARDVDFEACLAPAVVGPDGAYFYGPKVAAKEHAINGMASWVTTMDMARADDKCGDQPLVVRAAAKPARRRVAVGADDAPHVAALRDGSRVLRTCKVIIIIN
jgi:hypothetical protein